MSAALVLVLDDNEQAHLVRALAEQGRWCRVNGARMPAALGELLETLAARSGQERPELACGFESPEAVTITYQGAAARLSVSVRTVRRLVADKHLPAIALGRRRLIRVADLEAYVASLGGA